MRLGQLARQLEVKPDKIVSFLEEEKQITIKEHPNSKVENDLIDLITDHFKPAIEEEVETEDTPEVLVDETPIKEEETVQEEEASSIPKEPDHIETVKPEAQELKIIGKIDLPDKSQINVEVDGVIYDQETLDQKKKEELKEERELKAVEKEEKRKEDEEKKKAAREKRLIEAERKAMLETEKSNILSKEEERKKDAIIRNQQEREASLEKKRKEKQADHYAQKFTEKSPGQKKKKVIIEEPVENQIEEVKETSPFKRFIKWLNT